NRLPSVIRETARRGCNSRSSSATTRRSRSAGSARGIADGCMESPAYAKGPMSFVGSLRDPCGDVMTGRGVDQIQRFPCEPAIHEPYMDSALGYVRAGGGKEWPDCAIGGAGLYLGGCAR